MFGNLKLPLKISIKGQLKGNGFEKNGGVQLQILRSWEFLFFLSPESET